MSLVSSVAMNNVIGRLAVAARLLIISRTNPNLCHNVTEMIGTELKNVFTILLTLGDINTFLSRGQR